MQSALRIRKPNRMTGQNACLEIRSFWRILNIVLIGIADELPEHDDKYELHRLLSTLLSTELAVDEKINIIKAEYDIPVDDKLREDVSAMCNLSQGIIDNTLAQVIMNLHREGDPLEKIARTVGKTAEEVQAIIEKRACNGINTAT